MNTQTFSASITHPKTLAGRLRTACTTRLLPVLLLVALPSVVQAQFLYVANQGTITVTGYTGPGGDVTIPDMISGLPVISIGDHAFNWCSLTSVTIPNSATSIGNDAFYYCTSLTNATIGSGVISIGDEAFGNCTRLTKVAIPNSVASIGNWAFRYCTGLTNVTIGSGVTSIGDGAFGNCTRLTSISADTLNSAYSSVEGVLFNKTQTRLVQYPAGIAADSYTIPNGVTCIGNYAFAYCLSLFSVTIPNSVTSIGESAFYWCFGLGDVTIPNSISSIGDFAFAYTSLFGVTIPNTVTSIGESAFCGCSRLTSITIPNSVTSISQWAFAQCDDLTTVTIPNSIISIGDSAFISCPSLNAVYCQGDAPSVSGSIVFQGDNNATVYYLPGTTGWGSTFGGRPTALWIQPPTILSSPQTQTAEAVSAVAFRVKASSPLPLFYFWYLNATNLLSSGTNWQLDLPNVQLSQSGAYTVVISNVLGADTSAPALLNVIAPVERRPVPGVKVTGETASLLNVDYAETLSPAPNWTPLGSVSLTGTPQYCFDLTLPLPPQRFYRAWQTGSPTVRPSLDLHLVPAITLTGTIGHFVRLDYINQFGPTDAWVPLATVPLTNSSQLYFDISAPGQPPRLYRLVPSP